MSGTSQAEGPEANFRFRFGLTNLELDQSLQIGEVVIEPILEAQEELKKRSSMSNVSLVTAIGTMQFAHQESLNGAKERIDDQHMDLACLLLSLSNRSHVQMVNLLYEEYRDGEWALVDASLDRPFLGKVRPRPIHLNHEQLANFIQVALPQLAEDYETRERGLVSALRLFCSTYEFDYGEPLYLKTWMALEVVFGAFNGEATIIDRKSFDKLRKRLKAFLRSEEQRDLLPAECIQHMESKLGELHRYSAKHQAYRFFESALSGSSELIPTEGEFASFTRVRNQITHTGRFDPGDPENYNMEVYDLRLKLSALVETVLFAMFGADVSLIDPPWRYVARRDRSESDD